MKLRKRKTKGSISFFIDYRENGQRRRHLLKGIHDRKLAEIAFGEFRARFERGVLDLPTDQNLTLGECLEDSIAFKRDTCTAAHVENLEAYAVQIVDALGGASPVKSLDEKAAGKFKRARRAAGDSPPTINKKLCFLKGAIERAVRDGKIPRNPLAGVERVSDPRPPKWRWLSEEEVDALLDVLRDGAETTVKRRNGRNYRVHVAPPKGLYPVVVFLVNTGARRGEAWRLRWSDADFGAEQVRLVATKKASRGRKAEPRYVPMNEAVQELLSGLERRGEFVFRRDGNLQRKLNRACQLAGIEGHVRVHDLRHTTASHLAIGGTPLAAIKELLGHSTMEMTMRYAHLSPSVKTEAMGQLNFGAAGKRAKVVPIGESGGG